MKHLEFFKKGLQHFKNLNLKDSPPQIKKKSIKPLSYKF